MAPARVDDIASAIRHARSHTTIERHNAAIASLRAARAAAALTRLAAGEPIDDMDRVALLENRDVLQTVLDALPLDVRNDDSERGGVEHPRHAVSTDAVADAVPTDVDLTVDGLEQFLQSVVARLSSIATGGEHAQGSREPDASAKSAGVRGEDDEPPTLISLQEFFKRLSESIRSQASAPSETVVRS
jgi:hypothetical protein